LAFNAQAVDVTNADSAGMWRELLEGGVKSASLSGSGVFKDAASDAALRQVFFDGTTANYQVVVPGFGTVAGPFRITQLQYDGPHDGEVKVSLALASAGALTFTAS
jgi:TP901-1 family phage major tail protein